MKPQSHRTVLRAVVLGMSIFLVSALVAQAAETGRIFGALNTSGASGGSDAYLTTPDPVIPPGSWSAALTATGSFPTWPFIEAGALKNCGVGCSYYPYSTSRNRDGVPSNVYRTDIAIAAGGWYRYKNFFTGGTSWEAQFCSGAGCIVLQDVDLKVSDGMPFEASGGESSSTTTFIGTTTSNNQWWDIHTGGWRAYCWDTPQKNVGVLGNCGANHDWSVHFP